MSKAVVLQHVDFEGPGRIVDVFRDYGIPLEIRHLYKGDEVPDRLDDLRVLIIMGGPMGVSDIGNSQYPFLADEVDLIRRTIERDRPTIGICLGAQLIAHAAGAKVYPNTRPGATPDAPATPVPEIGWLPLRYPFPGGTEPLVYGMHDGSMMFHWHFDTFDLPRLPAPGNPPPPPAPAPPSGNVLLASSAACKNQAFRFKNRIIGFQYHVEMTPEGIETMLDRGAATVQEVLGADGAEQIRSQTSRLYPDYRRLGDRMIRNWIEFLKLS